MIVQRGLRCSMYWPACLLAFVGALSAAPSTLVAATPQAVDAAATSGFSVVPPSSPPADPKDRRLIELAAGDSVTVQVFGQPDMGSTEYVGDKGTISLPLVGSVLVAGLSPMEAAKRVEEALKSGQFLLDPHVTLTVTQSHSQRISVLGEVRAPGRYVVEPNTSIFDLLALAGGITEASAEVIYVMRTESNGDISRLPVVLKSLTDSSSAAAVQALHSGDSLFVPRAEQFYIYGEVKNPDRYPIGAGMTVIQAIGRAGGVTERGSERRVDIKRKGPDGKYLDIRAKIGDPVLPDDVLRVKESIF